VIAVLRELGESEVTQDDLSVAEHGIAEVETTLETTQRQMDGFLSQLPFIC